MEQLSMQLPYTLLAKHSAEIYISHISPPYRGRSPRHHALQVLS